jgi:hypothetical protein
MLKTTRRPFAKGGDLFFFTITQYIRSGKKWKKSMEGSVLIARGNPVNVPTLCRIGTD